MSGFIWTAVTSGDTCALPDPRNAYRRQSLVGTGWHEVRLGIFFTFVPAVSSDAACSAESITAASCLDWFTLGLKDDSDTAPGRAGASFIGYCFPGTTATYTVSIGSNAAAAATLAGSSSHSYIASVYGASLLSADVTDATFATQYPVFKATSAAAFLGLRLIVNNAGLSNQTVTPYGNATVGPIADVSANNLRTYLFSSTWSAFGALTWNSSGAALTLPSDFYVRSPFNNNRVRLSCHEVVMIS